MILLRRLHVINWMYYGIQTMDLDKSNLLAGPTGSGKSSLVDALQVIMLGEIGSRYFNRSATGGKSDRTIVTYLRGKYNDNDYKRADKAFSSYIVVDFYDELHREEFCYGVVFDLAEDNTHDKDYFYIGESFTLDWALKKVNGKPSARSRREFKDSLKEDGIALKLFAPVEYRNDLLIRLGIYDEHFFQVFRTAVAYVPLDKIEDFIVHNICHMEDNIDVPRMKSAIHEYQRMQRDMEDFLVRQRELAEIKSIYDDYTARYETYLGQEYIVQRAQVDRFREEQLQSETQMSRLEDERETCTLEAERLEKSREEKEHRSRELALLIDKDAERIRKEELNAKLDACNQEIDKREKMRDSSLLQLGQRLSAWQRRLQEAIEYPVKEGFDRLKLTELSGKLGLYAQYTKDTFSSLDCLSLSVVNRELDELRIAVMVMQNSQKRRRDDAKQKVEDYRKQLGELRKGIKSYPSDLLALRDHLQFTLSNQFETQVQLHILADLISITDPSWVNVIEGYLRLQRLFLLTEPEYYKEAVRIFRKYSYENRCYSYRIVNTESVLAENRNVLDNSLAKVVETEHVPARKYIDYLLGRVERVEDIEYVEGRRTAVTMDGMLYTAYTAARMNEDDWRMKYIGQDSIARQIEEIERLLELELQEIESMNSLIAPLESWTDEKTMSDEFIEGLEQAVAGVLELPGLDKECDELWAQIQTVDDSFVKQLEDEYNRIDKEMSDLLDMIKTTSGKISVLSERHNECYRLSEEKEQAWEEASGRFYEMYPEGNDVAERTSKRYESELTQKGSAEKVQIDFERGLNNTKGRIDSLTQSFRQKVEMYNYKHSASAISTDLSSGEWRKAYDEVHSVQLATFTDRVTVARNKAEEIFHNDFINQIKRNIDTVKREITLLNKAMEEYTFGTVQYRFKCVPTENAEMRRYYDMITNFRLDGASIYDLMEPGADMSEYEPLIKTLFQLIASEGIDAASRQQVEENIDKFKSFQTYLRFDLVEVGENGKEYPLSKTMGSKSGGERQTPFYVAILASLMKTYKMNQNANCLQLVIFDEAFDKIDTSRIEECINMLRYIGFQFIIAAPDNKAPYITPLVERTWVVVKPDEMNSILHLHSKRLDGAG